MAQLILREYTDEDIPELVSLYQRGLTEQYNYERWVWLYKNVASLGSHIVVAESDGRIVGAVGEIRKRFEFNDQVLLGGRHLDPVVDKSMRGKGIFLKLLGVLNELCGDVDLIYCFPNSVSYPGFKKAGYKPLGPITTPYCQLGFWGLSLKEKMRYFLTGVKTLGRKNTNIYRGELEELKELKSIAPSNKYALLRDYSYLKWRYAESPIYSYEVLIHRQGDIIQNACIARQNMDGSVSVVDFVRYHDQIDMGDYLVAFRELYGKVTVVIWDNNVSNIHKYFWGKSPHNFLVRKGKSKMPEEIFQSSFWYVTSGDVESN
jgi:hypothetical protein